EERRANLMGFAHGAFLTADAVEHILATTTAPAGLDIYVFSADEPPGSEPLHLHRSRLRATLPDGDVPTSATAGAHVTGTLKAGDARWNLVAVPVPGGPLEARYDRTWIVLASGLLLSLILTLYMRSSLRQSRELQLANEEITVLAESDALTGLANRLAFNEQLAAAFAARRQGGPAFAVLYFDLDHFKDINDTLGH